MKEHTKKYIQRNPFYIGINKQATEYENAPEFHDQLYNENL